MRFGVRRSSSYYLDYSCEPPCEFPTSKCATAENEHCSDYSSFKKQRSKRSQTQVKLIKSQGTRRKKQKNKKCEYPPDCVEIGDIKKNPGSSLCQGSKPEILQLHEDHTNLTKKCHVTPEQTKKLNAVRNVQSDPQIKNICPTSKCAATKRRKVLKYFCASRRRNKKNKQVNNKVTSKYEDLYKKKIQADEDNIGVLRRNLQYREIPSLYSAYGSVLSSLKNFKSKKNSKKVVTDLSRKTRKKQSRCFCSKDFLCVCDKKSKSVCTYQRVTDTGSQTRKNQPSCFCLKGFSCGCHLRSKNICTCQKVTDTGSQTQKKQLRCFCSRGLFCVCDKKLKTICTRQRLRKTRCLSKRKKSSKSYDHIIASKCKGRLERRKQVNDAKVCPKSFSAPSQLNEIVYGKNRKKPNRKKYKQNCTYSDSPAANKLESLRQLFCIKMNKRSINDIKLKNIAQKTAELLRNKVILIKNQFNETKKPKLAKDMYIRPKSWSTLSCINLHYLSESASIRKPCTKKLKQKLTDESSQTWKKQPDCPCPRDFVCVCDKELRRVCTSNKLAKAGHVSKLKNASDSSITMCKSKNHLKQRLQIGDTRKRSKSSDAQPHANLLQLSEPVDIRKSRRKKKKQKSVDSSSQTCKKQPSCFCPNDIFCLCDKKFKSICKCKKFGKIEPIPKFRTTSDILIATSKTKNQLKQRVQVQSQLIQTNPTKKISHKIRRHSRSQTSKQTPSCHCFKDLFCLCDKKLNSICTCEKIRNAEYISQLKNNSCSYNHIIASQPKNETSYYKDFKTKSIKSEMINKKFPSESNRSIVSVSKPAPPLKFSSAEIPCICKNMGSYKHIAHDVKKDMGHMKTVRNQKKKQRLKSRRYISPTLSNRVVDHKPSTFMTPLKSKVEIIQVKKHLIANNGVAATMKKPYNFIHYFIKQIFVSSKNKYKNIFEEQSYKNRRKNIILSCHYPKKESSRVMKHLSKTPRNVYQPATTKSFSSANTRCFDITKTSKKALNYNRNGKMKNNNIKDLRHKRENHVERKSLQDPRTKITLKSVVDERPSLAVSLYKCLTKARNTKKSEENYSKQDKSAIEETKQNTGQMYVPKKLHHKAINHPFIKPQALYCECINKSSQKLFTKQTDEKKKVPTNLNMPELFDKYHTPETKTGTLYNPTSTEMSRSGMRHSKCRDKASKNIRFNHIMINNTIDDIKNNRHPIASNITAIERPLKRRIKNKYRKKNNLNSNDSQELIGYNWSRDINKYSRKETRTHDRYTLDKDALAKPAKGLSSMNRITYCKCRGLDSQLKSRIKGDEEKKKLNVEDLKVIDRNDIKLNQNEQQRLQNIRYNIIKLSNPAAGYRSSVSVRDCECTNTDSENPLKVKVHENENTRLFKSLMNPVINCKSAILSKKCSKARSNKLKKLKPRNSKTGSAVIASKYTFNPTPSNKIGKCKCTKKVADRLSNEEDFKKPRYNCKDCVKTHSNSFGFVKLSKPCRSSMPIDEIIDYKFAKESKRRIKESKLAIKQEPMNSKVDDTSAFTSKYIVNNRPSHIISICKTTKKDSDQFNKDDLKKTRYNLKDSVDDVKTNSNSIMFAKSSKPFVSPVFARAIIDCPCSKVSEKRFKSSSNNKIKKQTPINLIIATCAIKSKDTVNLGPSNVVSVGQNLIKEQITGKKDILKTQKSNLIDHVHREKTHTIPIEVTKAFIGSTPMAGADCVSRSKISQYFPIYQNNGQSKDFGDISVKTKRQQKSIYSIPKQISGKCDAKLNEVAAVPKRMIEYEFNQLNEYCIKSGPEYTSDENKCGFFRPLEKCYLRKYNNTEGKLWKLKKNVITVQNYRATVISRPIIVSKPTYKLCECRHMPLKNKRLQKKQIRDSQAMVKTYDCPGKTIVGSDQTSKLKKCTDSKRTTTHNCTRMNNWPLRNSRLKIKPKLTSVGQQCKSRNKVEPYSSIENRCTASRSYIGACKPIIKFRNLKEIKDCGHTSKINKYICNDTQTAGSRPKFVSKSEVTPIISSLQTKSRCVSKNRLTDAVATSCCKNELSSNRYKYVDDANIQTKKYSNFFVNNVLRSADIPNMGSVMLFCKCGDKPIQSKKHKLGKRQGHSQICTKVYKCGKDVTINKCDTKEPEKTSCKKAVTVVSAPAFSCGCERKTGPYLVIENCSRNIKCNEARLNPKVDYYIDNANVKIFNSKRQINIARRPTFSSDSPNRKAAKKHKTLSSCQCKELNKTNRKKNTDAKTPTVTNTQSFCSSLCQKVKFVVSQRIPLFKNQFDKIRGKSVASCLCQKEMLLRSQKERKKRAKLLLKKEIERDRLVKMHNNEIEKNIKAEQTKLKAEAKDIATIDESYGTNCLLDFFVGVIAIGFRTANYLIKSVFKIIIHPKRNYRYTRQLLKYPAKTIKYIRERCSIIWQRQLLRMARTIRGSRTMSIIADEIREQPLYQAFESRNKTPKEIKAVKVQIRIRRRRREFRDRLAMQGCNNNLFILTLRQMPCFWVYHICPGFYPQCLTVLKIWRDYTNLILFCLAIFVWSPCILAFELCRTLMCCLLCAR